MAPWGREVQIGPFNKEERIYFIVRPDLPKDVAGYDATLSLRRDLCHVGLRYERLSLHPDYVYFITTVSGQIPSNSVGFKVVWSEELWKTWEEEDWRRCVKEAIQHFHLTGATEEQIRYAGQVLKLTCKNSLHRETRRYCDPGHMKVLTEEERSEHFGILAERLSIA